MKTILVIEMPDNLKNHLDKIKVDVIGTLNGQELFHRLNQPLKSMPDAKETETAENSTAGRSARHDPYRPSCAPSDQSRPQIRLSTLTSTEIG